MKTEMTSCPDEANLLPGNFPRVVISLDIGRQLARQGREIEVDFSALTKAMLDHGIPEEEFANVNFVIGRSSKLGLRGKASYTSDSELEALDQDALEEEFASVNSGNQDRFSGADWNAPDESHSVNYSAAIYPTLLQIFGRRSSSLQKTVIHELQHIGDYIEENNDEEEKSQRREKIKIMRRRIGVTAMTTSALLAYPGSVNALVETIQENPALSEHDLVPIVLLMTHIYATLMTGPLSKHILYKTDKLERRAFAAAKNDYLDYPEIIQINKMTRTST